MKISIIIPTLNEEKALKKTIDYLRQINQFEYEIIISDGNSTDDTKKIAESFADKLVFPTDDKKLTIGAARNFGASNARGQYFAFLDADVCVLDANNFFIEAIKEFESDPNLLGIIPSIKIFPEVATLSDRFLYMIINSVFYIMNNVLRVGGASGEFQMVRKDSFDKIHGYDKTLPVSEDQDLFFRLSKIGKTKIIKRLHVFHGSRRAHQIGWPKMLYLWLMNWITWKFSKKTYSKEWTTIR